MQVYTIKVSKISCTNCASKIKTTLLRELDDQIQTVSVNILQEKVNVAVNQEKTIKKVLTLLQKIGHPVVGSPLLIQGGDKHIRSVTFVYSINPESQQLQSIVRKQPGIQTVSRVHIGQSIKLTVSYNCQIIKGTTIGDIIEEKDSSYKVINHRVQSFQTHKNSQSSGQSIYVTAFLLAFFIIFNMILPLTGHWYRFLTQIGFGVYTLPVFIDFFLTIYIINAYAKPLIKRSYTNYTETGDMNMQTLISLGCMSAFGLFLFFMVRYTLEIINDKFENQHEAIMNINNALTSSSIIVLVVTIGKYFENKVKRKIETISQRIFPESTLFNNMEISYVELKNRKLMIEKKKVFDVTLVEEEDILQPSIGRLLVDAIVLSGQIKAIQSTVTGNDEILTFRKGQRIQSGSIIKDKTDDALIQVENVFQNSILIEIGTQIKLKQNEEAQSESGIQAVCKTVSKYFVKTVVFLSISVMITWFLLLSFEFVKIPSTCNVCWIVERGIGVLVASCPCALGLAVPSVISIILNIAIKNGILIRNNGVFEKIKTAKIIAFDKTGTLFTRINELQQSHILSNKFHENHMWQVVAIVEKQIKHPLAQILYKVAFNRCEVNGTNFNYLLMEEVKVQKEGLTTKIMKKGENQEYNVFIGNRKLLEKNKIQIPSYHKTTDGSTELFLALNNECCLVMILNTHSNLRSQAPNALKKIMEEGKEVHILSGDSIESVEKLGKTLKIPKQNLHPEHSAFMKMEWIKKTQLELAQNKEVGVVMVGDGLNDIPCLQQASIGVSINAKSELNLQAADIILLSQNLYKLVTFVRLLQRGNQFIKINLFWAFLYNIIMMPIVAGVFYSYNITISPIWSSIAMSCSSILVVAFSHLLSLFNYDDQQEEEKERVPSDMDSDTRQERLVGKDKYMQFTEEK